MSANASGPIEESFSDYDWSAKERAILKARLENSGLDFMRYFFKQREGFKFIINWHHTLMQEVLDKVLHGEIERLIINIPPGYTKTEMAVLNFIAQGLALNPASKFIHASYSGELASVNSSKIKDTVESAEYQELWPMQLKVDAKGKKRWFTQHGGGMMAVPAGGQITGFRAGHMDGGDYEYWCQKTQSFKQGWFTGAFIIDDPVKPDDAYSPTKRSAINNRFNNTMRSRLAIERVPMIVIMQRIHEDDLSGFLLRGGSGDKWHHLVLPANVNDEFLAHEYDKDYTHGIPIEVDYRRGPLWIFKHNEEQLRVLEEGDVYTYSGQFQQNPSPLGGAMFKDHWWRYWTEGALPKDIDCVRMYCDTAQKVKEHNDYSVFQIWARSRSKGIFLLDQCRGKWEAPELESKFVEFWNKWKPTQFKPFGVQVCKVEDKSSGSSLIQNIQRHYKIPIEAIQRNTDKVIRSMGAAPQIAAHNVHLPEGAEWLHDYKEEFRKFTPLMNHKNDDQIDPTLDAIEDLLVFDDMVYSDAAM